MTCTSSAPTTGIDGYDVARVIHGDAVLRTTRLVALTGYAQPEDRERPREAGFDAHLSNHRTRTPSRARCASSSSVTAR
jgi:CheY-like chemotaxis protein